MISRTLIRVCALRPHYHLVASNSTAYHHIPAISLLNTAKGVSIRAMSTPSKPSFKVPNGWSDNARELQEASGHFPDLTYDIPLDAKVEPLIIEQSGNSRCLVQINGKFYIWNLVSDDVWSIVSPVKVDEIVAKLAEPGLGNVKVEPTPRVDVVQVKVAKASTQI